LRITSATAYATTLCPILIASAEKESLFFKNLAKILNQKHINFRFTYKKIKITRKRKLK